MLELANGFTAQQIANAISPRRLELTLLPTEKCSFACTYCYEDFVNGKMPPHVVEGVINLIRRRIDAGLDDLYISWFGGEPLIALKVIRTIATAAKQMADANGVHFGGGFTTNGYALTPALLEELVGLGQTYFQITLDGWKDAHDTTRLRADGKGTFDVIWRNLLAARDTTSAFNIAIRIHVTELNHDSLRRLAAEIGKEFGDDSRFSLNFQDVRDLGGSGASTVTGISARTFRSIVQELEAIVANKGELPHDGQSPDDQPPGDTNEPVTGLEPEPPRFESSGSRQDYGVRGNYICYAAKPNHLLIRSTGRVGKCTVALDDERNDLGFVRPDGTIELDQAIARLWSGGLETFDIEKLGCPIAYWNKQPAKAEIPFRLEAAA